MNNRKAEFILAIIGASLAVLGVLIMGGIVLLATFSAVREAPQMATDDQIGMVIGGVFIGINFILAVIASVFGFIAAFKMKNGTSVKGWSIVLVVVGGLCFFSYGSITGILFLIAGILSLVKSANEKKTFDTF